MPDTHHHREAPYPKSIFASTLTRRTGTLELMEDLGNALTSGRDEMLMMGGGTPAHIPEVQAIWRERMQALLDDAATPQRGSNSRGVRKLICYNDSYVIRAFMRSLTHVRVCVLFNLHGMHFSVHVWRLYARARVCRTGNTMCGVVRF